MTTPPNNVVPMSADNNGQSVRDGKGRFAAGNIGRPFGAVAKQPRDLLQLVRAMGNRAIQNLSDSLDKQEQWSTLFVLRYCLPANRVIELFGTEVEDVKSAMANGDLSPEEGKQLASAIATLKGVKDIDELRQRLDELEAMANDKK